MNSYEAQIVGLANIVTALKAAGLKDGIGMTKAEVEAEDKNFLFWRTLPRYSGADKKCYVTISVDPLRALDTADNQTAFWEFNATIDIFAKFSFTDKAYNNLLSSVISELEKQEFKTEIANEAYENDTGIYHKTIQITKQV